MSGGVDSAVAAARAVEAGHDVTGIHLALSRNPASYRSGARGCCTLEDAHDARRAADVIGIPFYVWDLSERFHDDVVVDFMDEYAAGRTPNPCLRCNEKIKFAAVLDRAIGLGFDAVATGHYAQLRPAADGSVELHRAVDAGKDQSYVLGVLTQDQLRHSLFPLGDTPKPEVRREAERRGLRVADKPDSHDICFVADGDNAGWLREKLGDRAPNHGGDIVDDATGEVLGRHDGTYAFTIGQRKGLRIGRPAPDGKPRFVLDIEPVSGTVRVGPREALTVDRLEADARPLVRRRPDRLEGTVQLRAHGAEHRAVVTTSDGGRPGDRSSCSTRPRASPPASPPSSTTAPASSARPPSPHLAYAVTSVATASPARDPRDRRRLPAGDRPRRGRAPRRRRAARPAAPARAARAWRRRVDDRPRAGGRRRARRRPPAGRLAADRGRVGPRPPPGPQPARPGPRQCSRRRSRATRATSRCRSPARGPWPRPSSDPRGDKILADHGARRELAQALAEGVRDHLADVRRRVPEPDPLMLQVDEPALGAVLRAQVPTASGFGRHRAVDRPELSEHLEWVFAAAAESGAEPWAHSCAPGTPLDLLRGAGARGLSVDLSCSPRPTTTCSARRSRPARASPSASYPPLDPAGDWSADRRRRGIPPTATDVLAWFDMLGLDPEVVSQRLLVTPSCGLAGASPAWARRAMALCRDVAANLS